MSSFQACPLSSTSAKVNWSDFTPPSIPFFEKDRIQKAAGSSLLGLAALAAVGTVYVALAFTATPIVIISTFSALAVLTIALSAASLYLLCKAPSKNDPDYCHKKAQEAGDDITRNSLGYEQIRQKYGRLIDLMRINVDAIRAIVQRDAEKLTFLEFKEKHGVELAYNFVGLETQELIKAKFLDYFRQEAKNSVNLHDTLQTHLQSKNARLLNVGIEDLAPIVTNQLKSDAEILTFIDFKKKHSFDLLAVYFDEETKGLLKLKFLDYVQQKALKLQGILAVEQSPEARGLGVTYQDLAPLMIHSEAALAQDYVTFIARNGRESLAFLNETARTDIGELFLKSIENVDMGGVKEMVPRYEAECSHFGDEIAARFSRLVFEKEWARFLSGQLDYVQLRARNGLECLMQWGDAAKLRPSFLNIAYPEAIASQYAVDRTWLGVSLDEIRNLYTVRMNAHAAQIPYLGSNGFKAHHGNELLINGWFNKQNYERYQNEVFKYLVEASLSEMSLLEPEMKAFQIRREDVLRQRWTRMPFQQIMAYEKELFFKEGPALFSREELARKVLQETQQVCEILRLYPEMIAKGILLPQDSFGFGLSVEQRLEREIAALENLEDIPKIETSLLFERQLVSKHSMKVKIDRFIESHSKELLIGFSSFKDHSIWEQLTRFQYIPEHVIDHLRENREKLLGENARNGERLKEIQTTYEEALKEAKIRHDLARSHAVHSANLSAFQADVQRLEPLKKEAERHYTEACTHVSQLQGALHNAQGHWEELMARESELKSSWALLHVQAQMRQNLKVDWRRAEQHVTSLKQQMERDMAAHRASHGSQMATIESDLRAVQAEYQQRNAQAQEAKRKQEAAHSAYSQASKTLNTDRAERSQLLSLDLRKKIGDLQSQILIEEGRHYRAVTGLGAAIVHRPRVDIGHLKRTLHDLQAKEAKISTLTHAISRLEQELPRLKAAYESCEQHLRLSREAANAVEKRQHLLSERKSHLLHALKSEENQIRGKYHLHAAEQRSYALEADYKKAKLAQIQLNRVSAELQSLSHQGPQAQSQLAVLRREADHAVLEKGRADEVQRSLSAAYTHAHCEFTIRKKLLTEQEEALQAAYRGQEGSYLKAKQEAMGSEHSQHEQALHSITGAFQRAVAVVS